LIGCRTQLGNQIRGLLAEYGIILPSISARFGCTCRRCSLKNIRFSARSRASYLPGLYDELHVLDERIQSLEERIRAIFRSNDLCQKIAAVEGVGPVIVTAIVAAVADGRTFRNGRQLATWLGPVP